MIVAEWMRKTSGFHPYQEYMHFSEILLKPKKSMNARGEGVRDSHGQNPQHMVHHEARCTGQWIFIELGRTEAVAPQESLLSYRKGGLQPGIVPMGLE